MILTGTAPPRPGAQERPPGARTTAPTPAAPTGLRPDRLRLRLLRQLRLRRRRRPPPDQRQVAPARRGWLLELPPGRRRLRHRRGDGDCVTAGATVAHSTKWPASSSSVSTGSPSSVSTGSPPAVSTGRAGQVAAPQIAHEWPRSRPLVPEVVARPRRRQRAAQDASSTRSPPVGLPACAAAAAARDPPASTARPNLRRPVTARRSARRSGTHGRPPSLSMLVVAPPRVPSLRRDEDVDCPLSKRTPSPMKLERRSRRTASGFAQILRAPRCPSRAGRRANRSAPRAWPARPRRRQRPHRQRGIPPAASALARAPRFARPRAARPRPSGAPARRRTTPPRHTPAPRQSSTEAAPGRRPRRPLLRRRPPPRSSRALRFPSPSSTRTRRPHPARRSSSPSRGVR